jgi:uncharacterized protein (DUF4415 family)
MNKTSTSRTFDDETPITQADIDSGLLVPRQRAADGRLLPSKKRVTLYLDAAVVEHFKRLAGERGYQTLINQTLKASLMQGDIESMLRRVIREELHQDR